MVTGIIDTDTHVVEPPDLWTSRVSSKFGDAVPQVRWDDGAQEDAWFVNGTKLWPVAKAGWAAWTEKEFPPDHPRTLSEIAPIAYDANARVAMMDEYGIRVQLLYPNVALFDSHQLQKADDTELQLLLVKAYNDWLTEWSSAAPGRLVPVTSLPFWDLDEAIAEMARCAEAGHRGVIFSQNPAFFSLPVLTDRHWDRLWGAAQEMRVSINFHIASAAPAWQTSVNPANGAHANYASLASATQMANAQTISELICGGICHRFPDLNFVSVESGVGWIPFALDALEWMWNNAGVRQEHPEYDLQPLEYFQRQIYGCFWFEREGLHYALDRLGPDNIMFETDFPHPSSMCEGPDVEYAPGLDLVGAEPPTYLAGSLEGLAPGVVDKILFQNAVEVYHLD